MWACCLVYPETDCSPEQNVSYFWRACPRNNLTEWNDFHIQTFPGWLGSYTATTGNEKELSQYMSVYVYYVWMEWECISMFLIQPNLVKQHTSELECLKAESLLERLPTGSYLLSYLWSHLHWAVVGASQDEQSAHLIREERKDWALLSQWWFKMNSERKDLTTKLLFTTCW